ncbi:MAG: metal ABC transporter permease [Synechococcaceae cyanobacterium]|nr:metal ABC transporter permease [Synechococcaceae cyanobacterium]
MRLILLPWWLLPLLLTLLVGVLCGLAGTLLVLRRRLLHSHLIAHAVLPGAVLALAAGLDPLPGGLASALLGSAGVEQLQRRQRRGESGEAGEAGDAIVNTVMAACLGLGVLLLQAFGLQIDLQSLLFGDPLSAGPLDLLQAAFTLLLLLGLLWRWHEPLVFLALDPEGAAAAGLPVRRLQLLLSLCTALVIAVAMAAVGLILVVGLLAAPTVPALAGAISLAAALRRAALAGLLLAGAGFTLALPLDLPPGPLIGVLAVGLLLLPRRRGGPGG